MPASTVHARAVKLSATPHLPRVTPCQVTMRLKWIRVAGRRNRAPVCEEPFSRDLGRGEEVNEIYLYDVFFSRMSPWKLPRCHAPVEIKTCLHVVNYETRHASRNFKNVQESVCWNRLLNSSFLSFEQRLPQQDNLDYIYHKTSEQDGGKWNFGDISVV